MIDDESTAEVYDRDDILFDDVPLLGGAFDAAVLQGGSGSHVAGAFVRHIFTGRATVKFTLRNSADVITCGKDTGLGQMRISALTLEDLTASARASGLPVRATPDSAVRLMGDAHIDIGPLVLGGAIAVSTWVRVASLWNEVDGEQRGLTIFNSFEGTECGDTTACRNAHLSRLESGGWFAFGNDVEGR
eukprot:SAG22_NODE_420_length_10739_cov_7.090320_5_plen_189_part_00